METVRMSIENLQCYIENGVVDYPMCHRQLNCSPKASMKIIRVSRMNATLEEVKEAAKVADAHEFIKKLPMQYYTYPEEVGDGLSGGEKQRIALARAFLKKNNFNILDEVPTIWILEQRTSYSI